MKKGISLITLIITIVVLIILSSVVIFTLTNKSGVVEGSNETKFKTDLKMYDEEIRMNIGSEYTHNSSIVKKIIAKENELKKYSEGLVDSNHLSYSYISEGVLTLRGNKITEEQRKWAEEAKIKIDNGEEVVVSDNEVITKLSETEWTRNDVTLTIVGLKDKEVKLHEKPYSFDNGVTWEDKNTKIYTENTDGILVKVRDEYEYVYAHPEINIDNIDKIPPSNPENISIIQGLNTLTVMATGSKDKQSGMAGYKYSIDGNTWTDAVPENETYIFDKLHPSSEFIVYAKAVDNVENESLDTKEVATKTEEPNSTITIKLSTEEWTRGPISATIECDNIPINYVVQYKLKEDTEFTNGSIIPKITKNTEIVARLYYEEIKSEIAKTSPKKVTNIDTTAPTIENVTGNPTNWVNSDVVLTINGAKDTQAGLHEKPYSFDGGKTWQATNTKTYTENTSNIIIQVRDKLENVYTHEKINIIYIDKLAPSITGVSGNPSDWTKNDVTLTINGAKDTQSGLHEIDTYSFDGGNSWQTSNTKTYKENTSNIVIKVKDNAGNIYTHNAINITYIDKTAPSITTISGNPSKWVNTDVTITINEARDTQSGLHPTQTYSFDGGVSWQTGNSKVYSSNTSNIVIKVKDKVGNIYTHEAINITYIDKIAPKITSVSTNILNDATSSVSLTINGASDTGGSNLNSTSAYSFDNGVSWQAAAQKTFTSINGAIIVKVRDNAGNIYTHSAITISPSVSIQTHPTAQTITSGNKTGFKVVASGTGKMSYQWYYNTSNRNTGGVAISGATSATLNITTSDSMNGRYYYCVVTASVAGITKTATSNTALLKVTSANYSITKSGAVTYYTRLAAAVGGAASGDTIVTLKNVTDETYATINKNITLNTNAKTITLASGYITIDGVSTVFNLNGGGKIATSTQTYAVYNKAGTSNLSSVTLDNTYTTSATTVYCYSGKITIANSTITGGEQSVYIDTNGTIIMNSGTINNSVGYAMKNYGEFEINGGTITSSKENTINSHKKLIVNGGNITNDAPPTESGAYHSAIRMQGGKTIINDVKLNSYQGMGISMDANTTLEIYKGSFNATSSYVVKNSGNLTIHNGSFYSSQGSTIWNAGTAKINKGTYESYQRYAIYNSGSVNIADGSYYSEQKYAIYNLADGEVTINGGRYQAYKTHTINNKGTITVNDGDIYNYASGTSSGTYYGCMAVGDSSKTTINDAYIYSSQGIGIGTVGDYAEIEINGGIITAGRHAVQCNADTYYTEIEIYGGTFTSDNNAAISLQSSSSTLTYGSSSSPINQDDPCCLGDTYGVKCDGTFYFYNGTIGGRSGPSYGSIDRYRSGASTMTGERYANGFYYRMLYYN